jgi:cytidylate kinase
MNDRVRTMIVTIDGPAGAGKSTLAAWVAGELGVPCLDTGAMFRTLALELERAGFGPTRGRPDARELERALAACVFSLEGIGASSRLLCRGVPVGDEIRTEQAGMAAAKAAGLPEVREFMKKAQKELGDACSLVAEGRDMGTEIFPDACCKIYLSASARVRAGRRLLQLREGGRDADLRELEERIRERDAQDESRTLAPLRPADDALIIDTTHMDRDAVFAAIMRAVREAQAAAPAARRMRRREREIGREAVLELLERGEYGVLALDDGSSWPYAVPLSYVLADGAVYFHCAPAGRKVEIMARNNRVCFTVVVDAEPVYAGSFSTYYASAVVIGRVFPVMDGEEKQHVLVRLAEKYFPGHADTAGEYAERSLKSTAVYRIIPELLSGKAKPRPASARSEYPSPAK